MQAELPAVAVKEGWIAIVQKLRKTKNLSQAKRLHAYIGQQELESHPVIGNYLVPLLVDCGSLIDAQHVFNRLGARNHLNEHSWTSLISGYIACGDPEHAFHLYRKMQEQLTVQPNTYTYLALLNACSRLKSLEKGHGIHGQLIKSGLERHSVDGSAVVGNTLVDMYGKCGSHAEASHVFDQLPARDIISWATLIATHAEHGFAEEAGRYFRLMQLDGVSPESVTFACSLKASGVTGALETVQELHIEITKRGLEYELHVGNTLVDVYSKSGLIVEACKVFDELPTRDPVSWAALLAGCSELGLYEETEKCFHKLHLESICPDCVMFICCLKACSTIGALQTGKIIHSGIVKRGLEHEPYVGNTLLDMYTKCRSLAEAHQTFARLPVQDSISWATLVAGYAEQGLDEVVLNCFKQMQLVGFCVDPSTFLCCLKFCSTISMVDLGQEIHANLTQRGLESENAVGKALVDMYTKCQLFMEAHRVFDRLLVHDTDSWASLIAGYFEHGLSEEAWSLFQQMQLEGIPPNSDTYVYALKACGMTGALETGRKLHIEIIRMGLEKELYVGNMLVDMYGKLGAPADARETFDNLPAPDAVSWNALITGYAHQGLDEEAAACLQQMQLDGISPSAISYVSSLKACSTIGSTERGQKIHSNIIKKGVEDELNVGNILVDMYTKCRLMTEAHQVFDSLEVQDAVSWAALIGGYAEQGLDEMVLMCFQKMQLKGVAADPVTLVSCLKACGTIGALEMGRELHGEIRSSGLEGDAVVGNVLIDMYGNCGSIAEALEVFDKQNTRDVVSWTAMIKAYGENHEGGMAIQCFKDMQEQGVKPDSITFTCLLTACSHASMVLKGQEYFESIREHGVEPTLDHYACMVDLFARSGHVSKAERVVATMQCPPSSYILTVLLNACKVYGKLELGQGCFQQLLEDSRELAAACLLMADIYASSGRWRDATKVEEMRKDAGVAKKLARASIEVNKKLHAFSVVVNQCKNIPQLSIIPSSHMVNEGYVPNVDLVSRQLCEGNIETPYVDVYSF